MRETDDSLTAPARRQDSAIPHCPQYRGVRTDRRYPVTGYCALAAAPFHLMIPSTEEFRSLCTTRRFCRCLWFEGHRGGDREASWPRSAGSNVWACPPIGWSWACD